MRKWIILGVVLLILVGGAAIAVMNLNSYLNSNKDWVRGQVEASLGREVGFDEVGVSLFPSIGARVKNLRIAEDPRYGKEDFVRAGDVQVAVKVIPALFGSIEVSKIVLDAPAVNVTRDDAGFNFDTIGKKAEGAAPAEAKPTPGAPPEAKPGQPTAKEAAAFIVSLMRIRDGEIHYVDKTKASAADLRIRDLDFEASDVSLTSPISVEIAAALFDAEKQNFSLEGTLGPLGEPADVQKAPLDAKLTLDPLDVEKLRKSLPAAAKQIPPGLGLSGPVKLAAGLSGSLARLDVKDLDLGAAVFGAPKRNLTVKGSVGPVGAGIPASDITVDADVTLGPVVIDNVKKLEQLKNAFPKELSSPDPVDL
jgi:AsmA protein